MKEQAVGKIQSKVGTAKLGTSTVLTPRDSIIHENCEELEAVFNDNLTQSKPEIILDFKGVSFMDSEGLELLVRMHEELKVRGGSLKLVGLNEVCRDILYATRLINTFHAYEDVYKAVKGES